MFRKPATGLLSTACADCGHVHVVATSVGALNELYEDQRKDSLQLSE
ncbi:MAG: hypothetical protein ABIX28_23770 [Vicinamibacterales bacterium]